MVLQKQQILFEKKIMAKKYVQGERGFIEIVSYFTK